MWKCKAYSSSLEQPYLHICHNYAILQRSIWIDGSKVRKQKIVRAKSDVPKTEKRCGPRTFRYSGKCHDVGFCKRPIIAESSAKTEYNPLGTEDKIESYCSESQVTLGCQRLSLKSNSYVEAGRVVAAGLDRPCIYF